MKKIMLAIAMSLFTIGCSQSESNRTEARVEMAKTVLLDQGIPEKKEESKDKRDSLSKVIDGFIYIDSIGWVKPESNND